ncbi:MAG TPA: hypothetical protein VHR72_04350, partial [Gemmataceae bacterium]|nr:hypothetical protein [Gemmataceae bacterium]
MEVDMFRFSLLRTIRTNTRALPPRRNRSSCRPNLETLEDRSVPAGQIITVGTGMGQVDLPTAISQSNMDAANTSPADPDIIHFAVGYTPPQLEGAVQNTGNLKIVGDVAIDDFSSLTNTGTLEVTGNLSIGHTGSIDGDTSDLRNGVSNTDSATLTVDGALTMGDDATIENWGTSSISVGGQLSFGEGGTYYNGGLSLDALNSEAAVSLTAGSFVMGYDATVYNEGASSISISTGLTLGDGSSVYDNGLTDSSTASLSVSGSFSIGENAMLTTYGHSQAVVGGNVTLGSNSLLENGVNLDSLQTDAASFTVHGNLSLGDASDPQFDNDQITNTGGSSITVDNNLTIYGQEDSLVLNGAVGSSGATITVGGQFSMAATGYFQDYGTLTVSGPFDAGTGNPSQNDLIAGVFRAGAGSSVTTNSAVWEVTSGGTLEIASTSGFLVPAGGTLTVDVGGTLTVDGGGAITVAGLLTVDGVVDPPSTMTVQGNGVVNVDAGGSLSVGNLIVTDSAAVSIVGEATLISLVASGSATV